MTVGCGMERFRFMPGVRLLVALPLHGLPQPTATVPSTHVAVLPIDKQNEVCLSLASNADPEGPAAVVQRGDQDMRLTTTTNVSVDGVMQGLGGPDEDRSGGFERGGWAIPLLDTETGDYLNQVYGGAAAFLFGRRTYEIFAGSWGAMADPSTNPIAAALNSRPKYVASTSLADPQWAGTTVLHGNGAKAGGDQ